MAEPVIELQLNFGTEGAPTWTQIGDAARWVGAGAAQESLAVAFPAGAGDGDDAFFDSQAAPNDGELWNEIAGATNDEEIVEAGRQLNQNQLRALETGAADGTADPPEFTAYDDATDAGNRTAPTVVILTGTAGSNSISFLRAAETTAGAPAAGWGTQVHDTTPSVGTHLNGNTSKETCATALAASGNKLFAVAACAPHDSPAGLTSAVWALQYTYV